MNVKKSLEHDKLNLTYETIINSRNHGGTLLQIMSPFGSNKPCIHNILNEVLINKTFEVAYPN
jgi:hypothetical protein